MVTINEWWLNDKWMVTINEWIICALTNHETILRWNSWSYKWIDEWLNE